MKTTINGTQITGYIGQKTADGYRWLFVNGTSSKTRRNSYSVAMVGSDNQIVKIDPAQALSIAGNREIAEALLAAS